MKLTNRQIVTALSALQFAANVPLKPRAGYCVARNSRRLREAGRDFDEARDNIFLSHGAEREGQGWKASDEGEIDFPDPESRTTALAALEELLDIECDVDIRSVSPADLGNTELPWRVFDHLGFMFEEDSE